MAGLQNQKVDLRQSQKYANYMRSLGWIVEKIDDTNIFIKKILFFSIIKIQRPNTLNLEGLKKIVKKYRSVFVNLEPGFNFKFQISNFKFMTWHLLPTKTVIIDLQNLNIPKDTRYEIRKAQQNGLKIEKSNDINLFYKLLQETMKLGGWQIPIRKEVTNLYTSFKPNNSVILLARHSGKAEGRVQNQILESSSSTPPQNDALSGCLLTWSDDTAHYMYAANSKRGLELGGAYFTLWEAIKFCQKLGLKYLDLEGIYDDHYPRENKSWQGFTKFKLGWGGKILLY